jgi:predicted lipid-binding transport protein (Tim44 family)
MDNGFQHLDIVFIAIVAALVLYILSSVLGRRTGQERQRYNPYVGGKDAREGDVVSLPKPVPAPKGAAGTDGLAAIAPKGSPLAAALTEIQLADRSFNPEGFLAGSRTAYEMVVTAFAKGDRRALKGLLSDEVYKNFEDAIVAREGRGESVDSHFIGIKTAEILEACLKGRIAELTVRFVCELISFTKNADGAVIEGDPTQVHEVRDQWTFARDTRASDPNWKLVAAHPA